MGCPSEIQRGRPPFRMAALGWPNACGKFRLTSSKAKKDQHTLNMKSALGDENTPIESYLRWQESIVHSTGTARCTHSTTCDAGETPIVSAYNKSVSVQYSSYATVSLTTGFGEMLGCRHHMLQSQRMVGSDDIQIQSSCTRQALFNKICIGISLDIWHEPCNVDRDDVRQLGDLRRCENERRMCTGSHGALLPDKGSSS